MLLSPRHHGGRDIHHRFSAANTATIVDKPSAAQHPSSSTSTVSRERVVLAESSGNWNAPMLYNHNEQHQHASDTSPLSADPYETPTRPDRLQHIRGQDGRLGNTVANELTTRKRPYLHSDLNSPTPAAFSDNSRPALKRHRSDIGPRSPRLAGQSTAADASHTLPHTKAASQVASSALPGEPPCPQLLPSPFPDAPGSDADEVHISYRVPIMAPGDEPQPDAPIRHHPPSKPHPFSTPIRPPPRRLSTLTLTTAVPPQRPSLFRARTAPTPAALAPPLRPPPPHTPTPTTTSTTPSTPETPLSAAQALSLRLRLALFKVQTAQTDMPMQKCMLTRPRLPRSSSYSGDASLTPCRSVSMRGGAAVGRASAGGHGRQLSHPDVQRGDTGGGAGEGDTAADSLLLLGLAREVRKR